MYTQNTKRKPRFSSHNRFLLKNLQREHDSKARTDDFLTFRNECLPLNIAQTFQKYTLVKIRPH